MVKLTAIKKKRIILGVIIAVALCFLLTVVGVLREIYKDDTDKAVLVDIPEGAGVSQIVQLLEEKEVIDSPFLFKLYEKFNGGGVYHKGVHKFYVGMSYENILRSLETFVEVDVAITIPEGYEIYRIAQLLEDNEICTKTDFYEAQKKEYKDFPFLKDARKRENPMEGYLFPDTYQFRRGQSAESVITVMLTNFKNKVYKLYEESKTDKTLDEIIIMASIVEREAANETEWGKVASVFYNRLEIGMKLQSCATVQYVLKERKDILSNEDIKIDSPYNTYKYEGLPIGPIASPGLGAIKAAISPEETEYLYFAATKDGSRNVFNITGEGHMETVKELQK
ncbi:MAG: endolytic transglycosylase MltG [Ruminococcaceae bacterium]|nr:endolytic transglycosylase MltG [Oscillospiraceae bacterium]